MKNLIIIMLSVASLFNCANSTKIESKNSSLSDTTDYCNESECYEQLTKNQLESILETIEPHAEVPLRFTYVDNIDNQNVLTDFSTLSDSIQYHFFIKKDNDIGIIDRVVGYSRTYGMERNYIVSHVNKRLNREYRDIGDDIMSEIGNKYIDEKIGDIGNMPIQDTQGKIANTYFFTKYNSEKEIKNHKTEYVIQCGDDKITLKDGTIFFIGYEYNNLGQETYAVLKDSSGDYTYYYDMNKLCSSII